MNNILERLQHLEEDRDECCRQKELAEGMTEFQLAELQNAIMTLAKTIGVHISFTVDINAEPS